MAPSTNNRYKISTSKDRYKVWFRQAEYDYEASIISLKNGFYEWSTYQAEQSVEKALKSVIAQAGWQPPRMHKIPILLGICNSLNPRCKETIFHFKHIESFTFISRYPFLIPGNHKTPHELILESDAKKAVGQVRDILDKIARILKYPTTMNKPVFNPELLFTKEQIQARILDITHILIKEMKPEKIILFGSFAKEYPEEKAGTMDLLIIANTNLSFIERIKKVRILTRGNYPVIEPLVYTPDEFKLMTEEAGEGFLETALQEGKVIYQK